MEESRQNPSSQFTTDDDRVYKVGAKQDANNTDNFVYASGGETSDGLPGPPGRQKVQNISGMNLTSDSNESNYGNKKPDSIRKNELLYQ